MSTLGKAITSLISRQREMSLYIHIPFCRQKCSYCNFYSLPINKASNNNVEQTCRRILLEIDRANTAYQKAYKTVFIGGGNPGILSKELLEKILIKVSENGSPSEVTIECNPENITDDLISLFQKGLATRLSTGIQSLSGKLLKNIGRSCADTSIVLEALKNQKLSQRTWIMNVDLIVGIPGQSLDDIIKDIHEIFEISKPEHFSIYDLTYEPGTPQLVRSSQPVCLQPSACIALLDELLHRPCSTAALASILSDSSTRGQMMKACLSALIWPPRKE